MGDDRQSDTQALSHKIVCEWLPAHSNRRAVSDAPSTDIAHHRALTRIAPTPARSHAGTQFYVRIQLSAMSSAGSSAEIAEYRSPVVIISFLSRTETHASVSACLRRQIRSILSPQTPKFGSLGTIRDNRPPREKSSTAGSPPTHPDYQKSCNTGSGRRWGPSGSRRSSTRYPLGTGTASHGWLRPMNSTGLDGELRDVVVREPQARICQLSSQIDGHGIKRKPARTPPIAWLYAP